MKNQNKIKENTTSWDESSKELLLSLRRVVFGSTAFSTIVNVLLLDESPQPAP